MIKGKLYPLGTALIPLISKEILKDFEGENFSKALVIFPHKRPRLFLQKYILQELKKPFLPPKYFDIDNFIFYLNGLEGEKNLEILFILIKILRDLKNKRAKEIFKNLNLTISWANVFLQSFEELDMELKEYSDIELLSNFKDDFEGKSTFLEIYPEVYKRFYKKLNEKNLITRGLAYKNLSKNLNFEKIKSFEKIYFVVPAGITKSEEKILKYLIKLENIKFYLEGIKPEIFKDIEIEEIKSKIEEPEVKFYPSSGSLNQILTLRELLSKVEIPEEEIAIVLPEAKELIPLLENVISAFPHKSFNISMGFPFNLTPLFKFIELVLNLQIFKEDGKFYTEDIYKFLSTREIKSFIGDIEHYKFLKVLEKEIIDKNLFYISKEEIFKIAKTEEREKIIKEIFEKFIDPLEEIKDIKDLNIKVWNFLKTISKEEKHSFHFEYFEKAFKFLEELKEVEIPQIPFTKKEIFEVFLNLLKNLKIYFFGSPLKGIQILGLLETRTLSFKNVFFLNLNEGKIPKIKSINDPLLTCSIRKILNLPGPKEEEEIQRHHFLHLLKSSRAIHCFYINNEEEEIRSRFLEQWIWEKEKMNKKRYVDYEKTYKFNLKIRNRKPLIIKMTEEIKALLKDMEFSPSSLDNYLKCPLKFYFENILKIKEKEKLEEEPEPASIGNIVHETMENLQKPYLNKKINEKILREINSKIEEMLKKTFKKYNFELKGANYLNFLLAKERISKCLEGKLFKEPFELILVEELINSKLGDFKLKGKIDRLDKINGKYRVVDYKSGKTYKFYKRKKEKIELKEYIDFQKNLESFQILVYVFLVKEKYSLNYEDISGNVYSFKENKINDINFEKEEEKILKNFLNIVVNLEEEFKPSPIDENTCNYCILKNFCNK